MNLCKAGQVRNALVLTKIGVLVRPVVKLTKLNITKDCDLKNYMIKSLGKRLSKKQNDSES